MDRSVDEKGAVDRCLYDCQFSLQTATDAQLESCLSDVKYVPCVHQYSRMRVEQSVLGKTSTCGTYGTYHVTRF